MARSGIERRRLAARSDGGEGYKERRQEIVRVAAVVFKEKGFAAATLNDIAVRLGTDRASLYYYVGNKEELLQEIVRGVINENVAAAERVFGQKTSGAKKIETLIEDMILSFDRNYPHMYVYIEDFARISRQETKWAQDILASTRRFEAIVVSILEEGQADRSLRADLANDLSALALFGMVNWTHRWYKPGSKHTAKEIAATLSAIFLSGYRSPAADA
ncbi:MAG TPA: TetR/AcrR family transcriptional regulator [Pseudonocardia sp.]|jgi:AcrR family transcriptional regulator